MRPNRSALGLLTAALGIGRAVVADGLTDVPSPQNFLRRATSSVTVIGNYIYIDGGEISQLVDGTIPAYRTTNQVNSTQSIDISQSWDASSVVLRIIDRPWWSKANQAIFTNHEKGTFYVWGGKWIWGDNMTVNDLWEFTPDDKGGGTWAVSAPANPDLFNGLHESEFGAYANTNDTAFYIGGVASGWTEFHRASTQVLPGMVAFDMKTGVWQNGTTAFSPFSTLVGGKAHYVPTFGPNGLVMVMGGLTANSIVVDLDWATAFPWDFHNLTFFDPQTKKQYWQVTTGSIPPSPRESFCIAGFASTDGGYEIFVHGGENDRDKFTYQDTYILSLPGFVWVKAPDSPTGRRSYASCVALGNRQMFSFGGSNDSWTSPDPAPQGIQLFDMTAMQWKTSYDAKAGPYERPADLAEWYKNGSYAAVQWTSDEVKGLFPVKATSTGSSGGGSSSSSGSSTSGTSSSSDASTSTAVASSSTPVGAIAGGVVGGVAGLALVAASAWFILRRRRNNAGDVAPGNDDPPPGYGYYSSEPKHGPPNAMPLGGGKGPAFHGPSELGSDPNYVELPLSTAYRAYMPTHSGHGVVTPVEMDGTPVRYRDSEI